MLPALRFALALLIGFVLVPSAAPAQSIPPPKLGGYLQVKEVADQDVGLTATLNRAGRPPLPEVTLGGNAPGDGKDSLRWGAETQLEQSGAFVRAEPIPRHRRGRDTRLDDRGWYVLGIYRVIPRLQVLAREEEFK